MRIAIVIAGSALGSALASAASPPNTSSNAASPIASTASPVPASPSATGPVVTPPPIATPTLDRATAAAFALRPIIAFEIRGASKTRPETLGYLAHAAIGDPISERDVPRLEQALLSSELFTEVSVALEAAPGDPSPGVIVVVTADDKHSWIVAPSAFALPGNKAIGVGFAENNLDGRDQKVLLYGQLGTQTSLFFGTFLDPAVRGSQLTYRTDLYAFRRSLNEYANPADDPRSFAIARTTQTTYLGGGALIGWNFLWWLAADLRLRAAYVYFRDAEDASGNAVATPEKDGWDVTLQARLTLDHRHHRYGVTWGSYVQLHLEPNVVGLDSYGYQLMLLRAYHSWRLFGEHELELRGIFHAGRQLPLHEDLSLGGVADLRGYDVDQFRGDLRTVFRAEYSVPLFKWRFLAFRALGFYDTGYIGFHSHRADRDYLPNQLGPGYTRNDVGAGVRVYLNNIVLPLLGFDLGYGIEGHSPEVYFEVGLTDF